MLEPRGDYWCIRAVPVMIGNTHVVLVLSAVYEADQELCSSNPKRFVPELCLETQIKVNDNVGL